MKHLSIRPARALAPAAALVLSLYSVRAAAQPEGEATPAAAEEKPAEPAPPAAQSDAEAAGSAEAEAEAPTPSAAGSAEASVSSETALAADAEASAESAAPTASEPAAVEEPASTSSDEAASGELGIIRLPDSAYPEPQARGIRGGSLWFTMHGLQWPYLPHSVAPGVVLGVSGLAWIDPSYSQQESTQPDTPKESQLRTQARFTLRLTPTYSTEDDWFVQAQAELVAQSNSEAPTATAPEPDNHESMLTSVAGTDDLWVRAGRWNLFDVQAGRFQGWEVYHFGMGLDLHTYERDGATLGPEEVPEIYGVTYGYYRDGIGNIAGHIYPTDYLRFELLGKFGSEFGQNAFGGRPVGVLDLGFVKVKLGGEYIKETEVPEEGLRELERRGVGAAIQGIFAPYVEAGVNGGYGLVDVVNEEGDTDAKDTYTTWSYGGFANVGGFVENLVIGVGANYTWKEDIQEEPSGPNEGQVGEFDHLQAFGAIQYCLFGQLYLKLVGAYAKARMAPSLTDGAFYDSKLVSGRLRASFYF